ncbi:MAG: rod shape-determining protein MreD [Bacteroidaceae bacterium]|nr:rod shape-determining protein MreD [Bacteroidaceae bacterium]
MIKVLHRMEWFVGLVLLQVLVLNQMHIGGYATPFFYIYFILKFNSRIGRNDLMLWAFVLGLTIDMFSNTPGMNAAAATCLAFFRPLLIRLVTLRDMEEGFRPGVKSMGFSSFLRYSLLSCLMFCSILWLLESFSFFHATVLIFKILTSTLFTMLCIFCMESFGGRKG